MLVLFAVLVLSLVIPVLLLWPRAELHVVRGQRAHPGAAPQRPGATAPHRPGDGDEHPA
jgi:hypothetical protein